MEAPRTIRLEDLKARAPALSEIYAGHMQESCMVCMDDQGHQAGVEMEIGFTENRYNAGIHWNGEVTDHLRRVYIDREKRVENGACAIALMLMPEFGGLVAVETSNKSHGIDYYLATASESHLIFNHSAVLEVSGIQAETVGNDISRRIRKKRRRLADYKTSPRSWTVDLPTYICVVEFSHPKAQVTLV